MFFVFCFVNILGCEKKKKKKRKIKKVRAKTQTDLFLIVESWGVKRSGRGLNSKAALIIE